MNSDTAAAKPGVLAALRKANAVIGVGDVNGWPRPPAYIDALAMLNACREIERTVPALPPPPKGAKDLARWVAATVEVRHQEETRRDVVAQLVLDWERQTATGGLAATGDYCARLVAHFDELVEQFDACADAPRTLTGHESAEDVAAHTSALRAASDLANAVMQRAVLADAAQEAGDIGEDIVWLILAPTPATTRDQVQDALATFKGRFPQTVAELNSLRPLGLRLAQVGEVAARRQRHSDVCWTAAHSTPDAGMRDHSYAEMEDPTRTHSPNARVMNAESDRLFAEAPALNI